MLRLSQSDFHLPLSPLVPASPLCHSFPPTTPNILAAYLWLQNGCLAFNLVWVNYFSSTEHKTETRLEVCQKLKKQQ